jgi:hypothetical protein
MRKKIYKNKLVVKALFKKIMKNKKLLQEK